MEKSKPPNHRAKHKPRASLLSDKGLDAANHNRASGGGRRMFLTSPLIEQGDYTHNASRLQMPYRSRSERKGITPMAAFEGDYPSTACRTLPCFCISCPVHRFHWL